MSDLRRGLGALFLVLLLVGAGFLLAKQLERKEREEVRQTDLDSIVVALRENRNRLEVRRLSGTVTTKRQTDGGIGNILHGEMTVRQPWSVTYFADLSKLSLDDYRWDEATRTLTVRAPAVTPDAPNIDESRQVVAYRGPLITRDMQTTLRAQVANGARQQAAAEAAQPENLLAANQAAKDAIARNLQAPLAAAGVKDITVVVRSPTDGARNGEQWDISPSIADVLAGRSGR